MCANDDATAGYGLTSEQLERRSAERMFEAETCSDMATSRMEEAQQELSVAQVRARIAAAAAVRAQATAQRSLDEVLAAEQDGAPRRLPPYRRRRLKQKAQREEERAAMMQRIEREANEVVSQASAELAAAGPVEPVAAGFASSCAP